ncbi:MAG: 4Fe-4S ferredoxin, partial [Armatimonadota bacterium]
SVPSQLRQWPVKLKLVSPAAGYFANAHLLLAADCAPFACADFHQSFLKDKSLIIVCPKFEEMPANIQKLTSICAANDILSITVAHMEVPCCFGLAHLAQAAVQQSGKEIPVTVKIVGIRGDVG